MLIPKSPYNNFRRSNNGSGANQSDILPLITDTCEIECDRNQLEFTVQVGNGGLADFFGDLLFKSMFTTMEPTHR